MKGYPSGRITEQHRDMYKAVTENGFCTARVSGKFLYNASGPIGFPAVGDWVMLECRENGSDGIIRHMLPRTSAFVRKAAGTAQEVQVVAANIDIVFLCMGLNSDFNLRRLERYLSVAWDSGAVPVVVLTKSDLCADLPVKLAQVQEVCPGADIAVCSGIEDHGYDAVLPFIRPEVTVAFIGSSGVGKSTLINALLGEELLRTNITRDGGKGRHTTTHRQMIALPTGGIVIDTPGMRELSIEFGELDITFSDIEAFAAQCRFRDCTHTKEPGCAVLEAVKRGELSMERIESYKKLSQEINYGAMNSRQIEEAKIERMFGSKSQMKQAMDEARRKNSQR